MQPDMVAKMAAAPLAARFKLYAGRRDKMGEK